ncbi:hypothetical protein K440DRAFT_561195, partial [Wilcoxina mikolae CBS 423.85]
YETLYYWFQFRRVLACCAVFHALLLVADDIRWLGTMWGHAQWTPERICGIMTPKVKLPTPKLHSSLMVKTKMMK